MRRSRPVFIFVLITGMFFSSIPVSGKKITAPPLQVKTLAPEGYVDFIFETGMLSNIERSANAYLGSGKQTIAEHSFRCATIGYVLSNMTKLPHDPYKLLSMCLFQKTGKARTGDTNYLQQLYLSVDRKKLWEDIENLSPIGKKIHLLIDELDEKKSNEALIAQDANRLEFLFFFKEQHDLGNPRALEWLSFSFGKFHTPEAQLLADELETRKSDEWWKKSLLNRVQENKEG